MHFRKIFSIRPIVARKFSYTDPFAMLGNGIV
jgi:hypothetical protein